MVQEDLPDSGVRPSEQTVDANHLRLARVDAIILHWNLPDETVACVASLRASHRVRPRIRIVDNGSTTAAFEHLRTGLDAWPDVAITRLPTNRGFAAGCNVGIELAVADGADYVLILNNDTIVAPDTLPRLLDAAIRNPEFGILAPAIYYHDQPTALWSAGAVDRPFWPFPRDLTMADLRRIGGGIGTLDYVTGCCMLVRAEAIRQVGGFDERYFMYYEDNDLCRRVRARGWRVGLVPEARLWHLVARSSQRDPGHGLRLKTTSRVRFYGSLPGPRRVAALGLILIQTLANASVETIAGRRGAARGRIAGLAQGIVDLLR